MLNCLCFPPSDLLSCSLPTNPFLLGPFLALQTSKKQSNSQCWKTLCHRQFPSFHRKLRITFFYPPSPNYTNLEERQATGTEHWSLAHHSELGTPV